MKKKFIPLNQLRKILNKERENHKSIVLANGGFDLLHIGHIRYLKEAKQLGDILVVALNSDHSLHLLKGGNRPIIDEKGRIRLISSLSYVDYVILFDEKSVDTLLLLLKPDFHCKGSDYTEESVPERETVKSYGGRTVIVGGAKVRSTSEIISSLKKMVM